MSGSLKRIWDYLADEVWRPLSDYSIKGASAPPDLFGDLFELAADYLSPNPSAAELE